MSDPVANDPVVLVDVADRVAVITLNRPDQRNALNRAVRKRLPQVITELDADDAVDVMILTGADPAFSAGVDLKEFGAAPAGAPDEPAHEAPDRRDQRGRRHRRARGRARL